MTFVYDLLSLVLPGAVFIFAAHLMRVSLRRVEGYAFLFSTLIAGWTIQLFADVSNWLMVVGLAKLGFEAMAVPEDVYPSLLVMRGMLLGVGAALVVNRWFGIERVSRIVAESSGDLLEAQLQECIEGTRTVEVTLKTGKSYVGVPLSSRVTRDGEGDVRLLPILSGYRDEEKKLRITTNYAPGLDANVLRTRGLTLAELAIVVRKAEIVSLRGFDVPLYFDAMNVSIPGPRGDGV